MNFESINYKLFCTREVNPPRIPACPIVFVEIIFHPAIVCNEVLGTPVLGICGLSILGGPTDDFPESVSVKALIKEAIAFAIKDMDKPSKATGKTISTI